MAAALVSYSHHNSFFPTNNSKINIRRDWFPALVNTPSHDRKEENVSAKKQSPTTTKSLKTLLLDQPASDGPNLTPIDRCEKSPVTVAYSGIT